MEAWTEIGAFSDTISGRTFERVELDILVKLCESDPGHVDYILIQRWDRIGRDVGEVFRLKKRLSLVGVELNCPDQWLDFAEPNWPVFLGIYISTAQSESLKNSDRTRQGLYQAAISGYHNPSAPVGYTKVLHGNKKIMEANDQAAYVLEAYKRVAEGQDRIEVYKSLRPYLNGIAKSGFYRMLTNPVYRGVIYVKAFKNNPAMEVIGKHDAIVSDKLWYEVNDIAMSAVAMTRGRTWQLDEMVKGSLFLKGPLKSSGKKMYSYMSRGRKNRMYGYYEDRESRRRLKARDAHALVQSFVAGLEVDGRVIDRMADVRAELLGPLKLKISAIDKRLAKLERQKNRLYDDYLGGDLMAADYTAMSKQLKSQISILVKDKGKFEREMAAYPVIKKSVYEPLSLGRLLAESPVSVKSQLVSAIFPDGFEIHADDAGVYGLRTVRINNFLSVSDSMSMSYEIEDIKKGQDLLSCPVLGGRQNQLRTVLSDLNLINNLLKVA